MKFIMNILFKTLISLFFCLSFTANAQDVQTIKEQPKGVKWQRAPIIKFKNRELLGYDRIVRVEFKTNANGIIKSAEVIESSGLESIDTKVLNAVKRSKFQPYQENGIYYPIRAVQPFLLEVSREPKYKHYPKFFFVKQKLEGQTLYVGIYAEADDNGNLTKSEIKVSSGLPELDNYALNEYREQAKFYPLIVNGKPYPIRITSSFRFSEDSNTID